jgi:hypothetical protein
LIVELIIHQITLPKLLDWYCKDFGKTSEKMLKSLVNYLKPEQKTAIGNGSPSINFQEFDWTPSYSLSHFGSDHENL